MDRKRLIGEVAARHGVKLEEDDPAFVLVTLAELTISDAQKEFIATTRHILKEYEEAAQRIQQSAGRSLAFAIRRELKAASDDSNADAQDGQPSTNARWRPFTVCTSLRLVLIAFAIFAAGFVLGRLKTP